MINRKIFCKLGPWILLKQETVSGSSISWAICKSAPRSRQITMPATHHSVFTGRMTFLPPNQQRQSSQNKGFQSTEWIISVTSRQIQFINVQSQSEADSTAPEERHYEDYVSTISLPHITKGDDNE